MSYFSKISYADSGNIDSFGRVRVCNPVTLYEFQNQYNKGALQWGESVTGTGVATHVPNSSSITLSTGGTANGAGVARQTLDYFRYHPGKSQLINATFTLGTGATNVRKRIGYFDIYNGVYFEQADTTLNVGVRTYTSGSVVDNVVAQSSWNIDKLNGTGISGLTLDVTKSQILVIDLQWLGVGRIRFGFEIGGQLYYCHEILNSNVTTGVYMTTANLPMRYEIYNTGVAAGTNTLTQICCTVITEGLADDEIGYKHSVSNGIATINVSTRRAVLSIRPKATFNSIINRAKIVLDSFAIFNNGNQQLFYEIIYGTALGGVPVWTSAGTNSTVEYDVAGTTITGGEIILSGYVQNANSLGVVFSALNAKYPITLDMTGANPLNVSIVITATSGTQACAASLNFIEYY